MKNQVFRILVLTAVIFLTLLSFTLSYSPEERTKEAITKDYKENYLASEVEDIKWTGNKTGCKKGKISEDTYKKVLQRINFFRRMAGVYDSIQFDNAQNTEAQAAALIMHANNQLSHSPTKGMKCYSEEGYQGAHTSNLSLLINGQYSRFITDQLEDDGAGNEKCGHRSWILFSQSGKMGFGATNTSYALKVINEARNENKIPEYYSWPPKGFVPFQLIYKRWSFYIPGRQVDLSKAKVEMLVDGKPVRCLPPVTNKQFGDNSIIWNVMGIESDYSYSYYSMDAKKAAFQKLNLFNKKILVKISNVMIGKETKNFKYEVSVFDPMEMN
jgi:hypothetical protein